MEERVSTVAGLVDAITVEMERLAYKPSVVKQYHILWDKLCAHSGGRPVEEFTVESGMGFLEEVLHIRSHPLSEATSHRWMKAIYLLSDFKRTGVLSLRKPRRAFMFTGATRVPFEQFVNQMAADGLSEGHIRNSSMYLERLSVFLDHEGLTDVSDLDAGHVHRFVESLAVYEQATVYHTACVLRSILRFLAVQGFTPNDLSPLVPRVRYSKKAKIPSAYSKTEIETLIKNIDRGNPRGKRDLALILLAARLGLRASDITGLKFADFQWETSTIEVVQAKTGRIVVLPLIADVGEAVIDYLRSGRPVSDSPFVFLTLNGPCEPMGPTSIHHVVYTRLKEAGIRIPPGKKHGPHALRHSLASAMLENNVPLPTISGALGHTDTESTSTYLKIDLGQLRACMLDVPGLYEGYLASLGTGDDDES